VFTRTVQLEGTLFQGREPDDDRYDFDFGALDSYGGRLTLNPTPHWSVAASYGYFNSPEELHPDENQHRLGASILYTRRIGVRGSLNFVPEGVKAAYGTRTPAGVALYARLRPALLQGAHAGETEEHGRHGMEDGR
jgi:hypothetical protein